MNALQRRMADLLADLKENHHLVGVRAEFEAEGTRPEEILPLVNMLARLDLDLTLKIGGCEAMRDIREARVLGASHIVAPMVESPYALRKFLEAMDAAIPKGERSDIACAVNIETRQACRSFDEMLKVPGVEKLDGIVIGRVDLAGSMGLERLAVDAEEVTSVFSPILARAKARGLETAVGGGVSSLSLRVFRSLPEGSLDRYETRKVVFECPGALDGRAEEGLSKAVEFELLWLDNKRNFYRMISEEDERRIALLQARRRS